MTDRDEAKAAKIVAGWYWQMAEGHHYRWRGAAKTMLLFYESAPLESDVAQLVLEYLRTREAVSEFVIANKKWTFEKAWAAKDAWYQTASGSNWNGTESTKVRVYWQLVQTGDEEADGPYEIEDGCKYKVTHEYYWDVSSEPELPESTSGVQYSVQGFTRDRETGLYTYIVVKRETVEQDIALYKTDETIFEQRQEAQFLGVKASDVDEKGQAASVGGGVMVERRLTKNPDCTSDVVNRVTTERKVEGARVVRRKTLRGTLEATTDRNLTAAEAAAKTAEPLAVGETRTVEKTPGGLRNLTVEKTAKEPAGKIAESCERQTSVHTDTTVENIAGEGALPGEHVAAETNKEKSVSVRLNEDGTADKTTTTREWSEKRGRGSSDSGGVVTSVTERKENATETPTGSAGVNEVVEIDSQPNDHGSKTTVKRVTTYHEQSASATSNFAAESATTTVKTNTTETPAATRGNASATPNEHGSKTTQVTEYEPHALDSGYITWQSVEESPRHTYTYECGIRVFKNLAAVPVPPGGSRVSISANINRYGLYDGSISYSRLVSWAEGGSGGGTVGGSQTGSFTYTYISDYTISTDGDGNLTVTPVVANATVSTRAYYGYGNEASEAEARANCRQLPGVHLPHRTYITSDTAAIVTAVKTAEAKLQAALANRKPRGT